jgi:hypothetical protein
MALPAPKALFAPLAARLPPRPAWLLPGVAGGGLLAAMFLMFALTKLAALGLGHVSLVTWLAATGLLLAALFPDRFSLLAYVIGVIAFVSAGQGVAMRLK